MSGEKEERVWEREEPRGIARFSGTTSRASPSPRFAVWPDVAELSVSAVSSTRRLTVYSRSFSRTLSVTPLLTLSTLGGSPHRHGRRLCFEETRSYSIRIRRLMSVSQFAIGIKLYNAHRKRLDDLERELANERKRVDEFFKDQLQSHFENIQRIADTTTLPHAIQFLSSRIEEELRLSHLTDRLMQGKSQPNNLTSSEKLELWDKLKYLSFTRMVLSLWTMTLLSLYIKVQVNILGSHLYIDTARHIGSIHCLLPDLLFGETVVSFSPTFLEGTSSQVLFGGKREPILDHQPIDKLSPPSSILLRQFTTKPRPSSLPPLPFFSLVVVRICWR
ncbi:hypothetical protein G4B88_003435 [Cannabis sativa]|uniref:Uncharacterized protein n=1 Tax=Cannabis sativa TaxID=3483 RepID=A0A7J6H3V0_CANSA|nr:hypothetical protein G4B88_003435 [Cannabis sativa]